MTFIATYRTDAKVLLHVPYDFQWQLQYQLVEPVHLPAGSTIRRSATTTTRRQPATLDRRRRSLVEQSWDEMFNGWMGSRSTRT